MLISYINQASLYFSPVHLASELYLERRPPLHGDLGKGTCVNISEETVFEGIFKLFSLNLFPKARLRNNLSARTGLSYYAFVIYWPILLSD